MHRQQSFHWLPHRAHSAEGDFHFAPGRELHSFFMKMFHSSCLFPPIHSIFVPFPALGIYCPCLAQLQSPGSAWLPAVPPLHPCAVITPWQGIVHRDPCGSVLELQLVGIMQRELSHNTTTCFHADFWKAHILQEIESTWRCVSSHFASILWHSLQFLGSLLPFANNMPRAEHKRKVLGGGLAHHGKSTLIYQHNTAASSAAIQHSSYCARWISGINPSVWATLQTRVLTFHLSRYTSGAVNVNSVIPALKIIKSGLFAGFTPDTQICLSHATSSFWLLA